MAATSSNTPLSERDIYYFRHRFRNRVFQAVMSYFAGRAEFDQLTRAKVAATLGKDPAQITRWFSGPGNWTLDTVSDLLLAMKAEMSDEILPFEEIAAADTATSFPKHPYHTEQSTGTTSQPKIKIIRGQAA